MNPSSFKRIATGFDRAAGNSTDRMRRQRFAWAVAAGLVAATGWSLLLTWTSGLPRVSDVSLAASAERGNTPSMWLVAFVVSSCVMLVVHAAIELLVRGYRRRAGRTR
jgi:hypothetical protein